jgi:homoserine dehydrogenase
MIRTKERQTMALKTRTIPVILVGTGNVGGMLLRLIRETRATALRRTGMELRLIGLADISGLLFDLAGLPDDRLESAQRIAEQRQLLDTLPGIRPLADLPGVLATGVVLADVTAAKSTFSLLQGALAAGGGVVMANKNPLTGAWPDARNLFEQPVVRYECTVGAGLPVIRTLKHLLDTGDQAVRIEGCLSGTLGYLCVELEQGKRYSEVVAQARALGYTEPDPRDDLSGHDVARKALILARTAGWPLEMSDLVVEPLYPAALAGLSVDEFLTAAAQLDESYARRFNDAQAEGCTLRYIAQVGPDGGTVGLAPVSKASPLGALRGPANYIAFHTCYYSDLPLVISGPGAGPLVTAAGVLDDLLDLAADLP